MIKLFRENIILHADQASPRRPMSWQNQGGGDLLQQQEDISRSKFNYAVPGESESDNDY